MFIKKITISNFRGFPPASEDDVFTIKDLNTPNGEEGSGLTVLVGENGTGKSTLLEVLSLSMFPPQENINLVAQDLNKFDEPVKFEIFSSNGNASMRIYAKPHRNDIGHIPPPEHAGIEFDKNCVLLIDKHCTAQTKITEGTRFGNLMEVFSTLAFAINKKPEIIGQLISEMTDSPSLRTFSKLFTDDKVTAYQAMKLNDEALTSKILNDLAPSTFLMTAVNEFFSLTGIIIGVSSHDNKLEKTAFLGANSAEQVIPLEQLGSGYEMIFSILFLFYSMVGDGKELVFLVDEPELHLHPKMQKSLVNTLLKLSKDVQIIIATHSSLLVKQLLQSNEFDGDCLRVLRREEGKVKEIDVKNDLSLRPSANEVNYIAFGLATEEYQNELYERLKIRYEEALEDENSSKAIPLGYPTFDAQMLNSMTGNHQTWKRYNTKDKKIEDVTVHTFIRHMFHHPLSEENEKKAREAGAQVKYTQKDLEDSIKQLRDLFPEVKRVAAKHK